MVPVIPVAAQAIAVNTARQVLQTRALQCSFSSVFHLRRAGMNAKDANYLENLFMVTVGVPIAILGLTGAYCYITNTINVPAWSDPRQVPQSATEEGTR